MAQSKQRLKRRKVLKDRKRKIRAEAEKIAGRHILEKAMYKARVNHLQKKLDEFKPVDMGDDIQEALQTMFPDKQVERLEEE